MSLSTICLVPRAPSSTLFPYTTLFRSDGTLHTFVELIRERDLVHQADAGGVGGVEDLAGEDRKSTRLNSSHPSISYAVFCVKKKVNAPSGQGSAATGRGAREWGS